MNKLCCLIISMILAALPTARIFASTPLPQKPWTLDDCISYAMQENIDINQSLLSQQESEVALRQSRANYWPSLSFSSGANYSNTPYQDTKNSFGANAGLNLNWQIFDGQRRWDNAQSKTEAEIAARQVSQTGNTVKERLMLLYVQALYAKEAVSVNQTALEASEQLCEQGAYKLEVGSISRSEYAQLESQKASERSNLVSSQAAYENYLLQLKRVLQLPTSYQLELADADYEDEAALRLLPDLESACNAAVNRRPEIAAADLQVENAQNALSSAKAGYYPSLGFSAGTGTSWRTGTDYTFAEQAKNGWSNTAGVNLSVPILQGRSTKSGVERAKLKQQEARLNRENAELELRNTVSSLWLDTKSNQERFRAATLEVTATQASYDLLAEQFKVGKSTAIALLTEKSKLLSAQQRCLQAKYMTIYGLDMLQFYMQ